MASDNLRQVGRNLRKTRESIDTVTRRIAENFPLIENKRDAFGATQKFYMEFYTYRNPMGLATMTLHLKEPTKQQSEIDISQVPLTITDSGESVGTPGSVGSANVWYPLVKLGDLNFLASPFFTVVFDVITYGTFTQHYKISFTGGEVDLSDQVTIAGQTVSILIARDNVLSSPTTMMLGAYLYGMITDFSGAGWISYGTVRIYDAYGNLYQAKVVPVVNPPTPKISVSPNPTYVNTTVLVTGTGFTALPTRLLLDGVVVATPTLSGTGSFSQTVTVGAAATTQILTVEQLS